MQNLRRRNKIAAVVIVVFLLMIIILGLVGHVGFWTILIRVVIYVPIFSIMVFLLVFLLNTWVDHVPVDEFLPKAQHKKEQNNQASNLGQSLDMKDMDDNIAVRPPTTSVTDMNIEPRKAADAIRQMLAQDKTDE